MPQERIDWTAPQRILVLGSSLSIQRAGYLPVLQDRLNGLTEDKHEWLNASLGGASSLASCLYTCLDIIYPVLAFAPTIVLIEKLPNDQIYHFDSLTEYQRNGHLKDISESITTLVEYCQGLKAECILIGAYLDEGSNNVSWNPASNKYYLDCMYEAIAEKFGATYISAGAFFSHLFKCGRSKSDLLSDMTHTTNEGSAVLGDFIYESLLHKDKGRPGNWINVEKLSEFAHISRDTALAASSLSPKILLKGLDNEYSNSLVTTSFDEFVHPFEIDLTGLANGADTSRICIFYIANSYSGWIKGTDELGGSGEICLFSHIPYFNRLAFKTIQLTSKRAITHLASIAREVDIDRQINTYYSMKNIDTKSDSAIKNYLEPLLERQRDPLSSKLKLVALVSY